MRVPPTGWHDWQRALNLLREAEVPTRFDPIFPADPLAHRAKR